MALYSNRDSKEGLEGLIWEGITVSVHNEKEELKGRQEGGGVLEPEE